MLGGFSMLYKARLFRIPLCSERIPWINKVFNSISISIQCFALWVLKSDHPSSSKHGQKFRTSWLPSMRRAFSNAL